MDKNKHVVVFFTKIYMFFLVLICCGTAFLSFFCSTYYDLYMSNETPSFKSDDLLHKVFYLLFCYVIGVIIYRSKIFKRGSRRAIEGWTSVVAFLVSLFWIKSFNCAVSSDAESVNNLALMFMADDYSSFLSQEYFIAYPHQIHMAFYYMLIYYLFGANNYIAFQIVNALFISTIIIVLQEMSFYISNSELISKITGVLSFLLIPLFMYSTYIYGDVPGYSLAIIGTFLCIRFFRTDKWRYLFGMITLFCIAYVIKENVLIFIIANILFLILAALYTKKWKYILAIGLLCVALPLFIYCIDSFCMHKANIDEMPQGTPRESWIAMGMEEGICGSGGFNGEFWEVVRENNYEYDLIKENRVRDIKNHLYYYINNPKEALKFYFRKYNIQWNDPSFSGIINIEWNCRHSDTTVISSYLLYGNGMNIWIDLLDVCHFLVLVFATVGIAKCLKNWSIEGALILMIIIGGILFHELLWEVKGRYALFYYVLLLPFSAMGVEACFTKKSRIKM